MNAFTLLCFLLLAVGYVFAGLLENAERPSNNNPVGHRGLDRAIKLTTLSKLKGGCFNMAVCYRCGNGRSVCGDVPYNRLLANLDPCVKYPNTNDYCA